MLICTDTSQNNDAACYSALTFSMKLLHSSKIVNQA